MCLQAAIVGGGLGLFGLLALLVPRRRGSFFIYGGMAAVLFHAAWPGSQCQPIGKRIVNGLSIIFIAFLVFMTVLARV